MGKIKVRKIKWKRVILVLFLCILVSGGVFFLINFFNHSKESYIEGYLGSNQETVTFYDENLKEIKQVYRGEKISYTDSSKEHDLYWKVLYDDDYYYVKKENVVDDYQKCVYETTRFVRTPATVYKTLVNSSILGFLKKGEEVSVTGFDILEKGIVHKYKISYQDQVGYVYAKYLVDTKDLALAYYDFDGSYQIHLKRGNTWGGGDGGSLDFYPVSKPKFSSNVMPDEVKSLYLNVASISNVDDYIAFAKENHINAFVVDIKDNTAPGYASDVMKEYSITNYNKAHNSFLAYQQAITKLKENGFYVIGRITVFKDSYYVADHPEHAIMKVEDGQPFNHNGSYWPSAYQRGVWEFNVELAKEAIQKMGFHEIQFDYVRFPDRTYQLEKNGSMALQNDYGETKAQAIQAFLMYACDEIHELGAYVSADVFGESAHNYVTGYGQYWGAISNVVDVISAMPYPDHFGAYEYGFKEVVWTIPYQVLYTWGSEFASKRQEEIPTPAIVRTWIQAYNTVREPYIVYDSKKVSEEISGLYDAGLRGGYMTWNASSSLTKYKEIKEAFGKEY